jgi:hypothetical protein
MVARRWSLSSPSWHPHEHRQPHTGTGAEERSDGDDGSPVGGDGGDRLAGAVLEGEVPMRVFDTACRVWGVLDSPPECAEQPEADTSLDEEVAYVAGEALFLAECSCHGVRVSASRAWAVRWMAGCSVDDGSRGVPGGCVMENSSGDRPCGGDHLGGLRMSGGSCLIASQPCRAIDPVRCRRFVSTNGIAGARWLRGQRELPIVRRAVRRQAQATSSAVRAEHVWRPARVLTLPRPPLR